VLTSRATPRITALLAEDMLVDIALDLTRS
jgi:hypothetical protein